ncbi:class I SAM-dependent methyltransferase [Cronbergia sp. UHCC 0137]|uniref:class I SAM-dependent methyltransferase n=1 Tax=Cronbergia sp. UHCC 0137 TaxID=3110239 RepID=UPI002B1FFDAE|nr:class I SAM-dependent methyltransferase [Cronbergia sp. UHCC 0137]MEA5620807.1 class I SAM-dependent methyltransferase [Cronbergia sp. UHCC 0137]
MVENQKSVIQSFFDKTSVIYSDYFNLENKSGTTFNFNKRMEIINQLSSHVSGRLLDCAVGDGKITSNIIQSNKFVEVTLVDISAKMLELAYNNCKNQFINEATIECFNLDIFDFVQNQAINRQYDLIICSGLIAHIPNSLKLLKSLKDLLSNNGKIILQTTLLDHPVTQIVKLLTQKQYFKRNGYKISYYTHGDIVRLCQAANFHIESVEKFSMGCQFLDNILPPSWNYSLESRFESLSKYMGSEAIYLLNKEV